MKILINKEYSYKKFVAYKNNKENHTLQLKIVYLGNLRTTKKIKNSFKVIKSLKFRKY